MAVLRPQNTMQTCHSFILRQYTDSRSGLLFGQIGESFIGLVFANLLLHTKAGSHPAELFVRLIPGGVDTMRAMMNRTDKFHLYYLFVNDIQEDKYSGLSHVAEHTFLIQGGETSQLWGKGYTYFNHVCLYFTCSTIERLQEVDAKILSGEYINTRNVEFAKREVIQEIKRLQWSTNRNEQLIGFVTNNRIRKFPIGKIDEIKKINKEDVKEWLERKRINGNIYKYFFQNANDMIFSTPVPPYDIGHRMIDQTNTLEEGQDEFLYLDSTSEPVTLDLYFRIPAIHSKDIIIKKAFFEYCIQRKLNDIGGENVKVLDHFFGENERYTVLSIPVNDVSNTKNILNNVRMAIEQISLCGTDLYKDAFTQWITLFMKEEMSNFDIINATKNWVLYKIPKIQMGDINYCIKSAGFTLLTIGQVFKMPIKIIIK